MTCSIRQALKDRWDAKAVEHGVSDVPALATSDNKFFEDGWAPQGPSLPYALITETSDASTDRSNDSYVDRRVFQLRWHTGTRESAHALGVAARKIFGDALWRPVTDEGQVIDVKLPSANVARVSDKRFFGVLTMGVRVSLARG